MHPIKTEVGIDKVLGFGLKTCHPLNFIQAKIVSEFKSFVEAAKILPIEKEPYRTAIPNPGHIGIYFGNEYPEMEEDMKAATKVALNTKPGYKQWIDLVISEETDTDTSIVGRMALENIGRGIVGKEILLDVLANAIKIKAVISHITLPHKEKIEELLKNFFAGITKRASKKTAPFIVRIESVEMEEGPPSMYYSIVDLETDKKQKGSHAAEKKAAFISSRIERMEQEGYVQEVEGIDDGEDGDGDTDENIDQPPSIDDDDKEPTRSIDDLE